MLTQFSNFRRGPQDIRKALVTGTGLSLERLSLLLQVPMRIPKGHLPSISQASGPAIMVKREVVQM